MSRFAVSAVGSDRPGIVSAVTKAFFENGCNLEDSAMTILGGHFAMMMVVAAPPGVGAAQLDSALAPAADSFHLVVTVRPIEETAAMPPSGEAWTVSIYGSDRPGIVHRVASLLAEGGVNIVDLSTRVIGARERPVYAMLLEVTVPTGVDSGDLARRLEAAASELGVECTFTPSDADIL